MQEPILVAVEREVLAQPLPLENHTRLVGRRLELLDGAGDDRVEIEPHALDRQDARPEPRHLENLVDEPQQPFRARRDDLGESPLLVIERTRDFLA